VKYRWSEVKIAARKIIAVNESKKTELIWSWNGGMDRRGIENREN
jgi:hypothetical protein